MMGAANTIEVRNEGQTQELALAQVGLSPATTNSATAHAFLSPLVGAAGVANTVTVMRTKVAAVAAGDLSGVEEMLVSQAHALDAIFTEMARRAALNLGHNINVTQTYMQLAMKAQSQCRTTLQTLAEIKNPKAVAFVKQANIAHGPQQVNNGTDGTVRAEKVVEPSTNEQSQESHELLPDSRAPRAPRRTNPPVETVGEINRTTHRKRKSR